MSKKLEIGFSSYNNTCFVHDGSFYLFSDGNYMEWSKAIEKYGLTRCKQLAYFQSSVLAQQAIDQYLAKVKSSAKKWQYDYPMAGLTADCILLRKNRDNEVFVLLIKRGGEPYLNSLALPGGFVNTETETLKEACIREIQEETNVKLFSSQVSFFKMADKVDRDPRGRTISAIFAAILDDKQAKQVKAGDDATGLVWIPFCEDVISSLNLAFDHREILIEFLKKGN